jgi:rod shape-determining protein MreB
MIYEYTGVPTFVAEDPLFCVARGTGKIIDKLDIYRRVLLSHK